MLIQIGDEKNIVKTTHTNAREYNCLPVSIASEDCASN